MDGFTLSFTHQGKQYDLEAKFVRLGYIHQFHINYENRTLIFEFDEERQYRIMDAGSSAGLNNIDKDFAEAMANAIAALH